MKSGDLNRRKPLERKTALGTDPETDRAFQQRGRESSAKSLQDSARKSARDHGHRVRAISPASDAQRTLVAEIGWCIACGHDALDYLGVDPAHIVPRSQGGCDSPLCVIPLCRRCHDRMDGNAQPPINLLGALVADWERWRGHYQHALTHELPVYVLERLAGARTQWSDA